jgi:choloylglycine hydrolase
MREVLDHAGSAEQALDIISRYNVDWGGGPDLHYLVADRLGKALLVEFVDGEMKALANTNPWHLATNFTVSPAEEHALGRCWRYDVLSRELESATGRLSSEQALQLLASVAQESTQWSVVYELSNSGVLVAMGREYDAVYRDRLQAVEGK